MGSMCDKKSIMMMSSKVEALSGLRVFSAKKDARLVSLALVADSGQEFYVELLDTYDVTGCSEFVIEHVLPRLNPSVYGQTLVEAQTSLSGFLACFDESLEICTDAPDWDWDLFCDLAYVDHRWPAHVMN